MITRHTVLAIGAALALGTAVGSHSLAAQPVYGWQLMEPEEWAAHRTNMLNLPPEERAAYRARHHAEMRQRAAALGLTLPEQPRFAGAGARRGGKGYGRGYGNGGPGRGYGNGGPGRCALR